MTTYTLTPAQCKALLLHIPKVELRFYLIGAHVSPDGIVSATDGKRALRIRVTMDGAGAEGIIPRELIERASKLRNASFFTITDGHVTLTDGTRMPLVDGKFPDVARVCPMEQPGAVHPCNSTFDLRQHMDARNAIDWLTCGSLSKRTLWPVEWLATQPGPKTNGYFYAKGVAMVLTHIDK